MATRKKLSERIDLAADSQAVLEQPFSAANVRKVANYWESFAQQLEKRAEENRVLKRIDKPLEKPKGTGYVHLFTVDGEGVEFDPFLNAQAFAVLISRLRRLEARTRVLEGD